MTEFNLTNGQAIELTKDAILIRGNHIEIDGSVTVVKDDEHASIVEYNQNGANLSVIDIDDEPVNIDNSIVKQALESLSIELHGKTAAIDSELTKIIADIDKLKENPE